MIITVINPLFGFKQLQIPPHRRPGVIYLPADYYSFQISLRRLGMKPKFGLLRLLMDPIGLRPHLVKEIPAHSKIQVEEPAVGDCGVPIDQRDPFARRQAGIIMRSEYKHLWWEPKVEILEKKPLYKAIFIDRGDDETWLYDTYTGKKVLAENPLFNHNSGFRGVK
jgi:hypothetical protein